MKISKQAKNAILIGFMCSFAYLAVYISRNMLGAITPAMIEAGYSEDFIGKISSFYLVFYAIGQLINGSLGDRIKAKWMVSVGLLGAGVGRCRSRGISQCRQVHPDLHALQRQA